MDTRQWFLSEHARTHSASVAPGLDSAVMGGYAIQREEDTICIGLTDDQLRQRPDRSLNSIAWLLWHMARTEDIAVNTVLRARPEVLDQDNWLARLRVDTRHIGTSSRSEEVDDFNAQVDVSALRAYRASVGSATQVWAAELDFATLDRLPNVAERLAKARPAFVEENAWLAPLWEGRTGSWFLSYLAVAHNYWHLGEAYVIRARLGVLTR